MDIGEWIKACRVAARLNQTQLGEKLGVTKGNVSAWENGRHEPSYSQMLKIGELGGKALPGGDSGNDWPFPDVARERIDDLSDDERREIQAAILTMLTIIEGRQPSKRETA